MKIQRFAVVLTAINLVLLLLTMARVRPTEAQTVPAVLRGRAIELVDERGGCLSHLGNACSCGDGSLGPAGRAAATAR